MKKLLAAMSLMGAASLAIACSVDATGTGEEEFVGESQEAISQWACTDPNGVMQNLKYQYEAALAVAAIKEMGDLELDLNFKLEFGSYGKLMLQTAGINKCNARGFANCPSTSFLLALQTMTATQSGIPGWNPGNFRNILETHYKRYKDVAAWDYTGCGGANDVPIRLTVTADGVSNDGVCAQYGVKDSLNFWYRSSTPGKLWCKFAGFGGSYGTNGSGEPENPFMKYVTDNGGREGIDPLGGDMNGRPLVPAAGQSCGNTAPSFGSFDKNDNNGLSNYFINAYGTKIYQSEWVNACCYVNNKAGVYAKHPLPAYSNSYVYCKQ